MVELLTGIVERGEQEAITQDRIDSLRGALTESVDRIAALEARSRARAEVIAASANSVVFIQGDWGLDDENGQPLRFVGVGPDGPTQWRILR